MDEIYNLKFDGSVTTEGERQLRLFTGWDFYEAKERDGNWLVDCEAKILCAEEFDNFKSLGNNEDYVLIGDLELKETRPIKRGDKIFPLCQFPQICTFREYLEKNGEGI